MINFAWLNLIFYIFFKESSVKYIEIKSHWILIESVYPMTNAGASKCSCAPRAQPGKYRVKVEKSIMK